MDSLIFIYALEGNADFGKWAKNILGKIEQGQCLGFAWDLLLAELIVKPWREGNSEIAEEYVRNLKRIPNLTFTSVSQEMVIAAARLRGGSNLESD